MADIRIKDLTPKTYDSTLRIPVDNDSGTGSIALSQLPSSTYSFSSGNNGFTVTPSGGGASNIYTTPTVSFQTFTKVTPTRSTYAYQGKTAYKWVFSIPATSFVTIHMCLYQGSTDYFDTNMKVNGKDAIIYHQASTTVKYKESSSSTSTLTRQHAEINFQSLVLAGTSFEVHMWSSLYDSLTDPQEETYIYYWSL